MKALNDTHLCIIGTGLMGSSLALALRGKVRHLHGIDPDPSAAPYFDTFSDALHSLYNADVIVLATPIRAILELLPQVGALAATGALITDLGSVKAPIMAAMAALTSDVWQGAERRFSRRSDAVRRLHVCAVRYRAHVAGGAQLHGDARARYRSAAAALSAKRARSSGRADQPLTLPAQRSVDAERGGS